MHVAAVDGLILMHFLSRYFGWLLLFGILLIAVTAWFAKDHIAAQFFTGAGVSGLISKGNAALANGQLTQVNGQGARELFEAALAISPDSEAAAIGLSNVANAAMQQAKTALENNDHVSARHVLDLAKTLNAPSIQLDKLEHDYLRITAGGDITTLLEKAIARQADNPVLAMDLYRRVLLIDSANSLAITGRRRLLDSQAAKAQTVLKSSRWRDGRSMLAQIRTIDSAHPQLPVLQALLGQKEREREKLLLNDLDRAEQLRGKGQIDQAAKIYKDLLEDSDDPRAVDGLQFCVAAMHELAKQLENDGRHDAAIDAAEQANRWAAIFSLSDIATAASIPKMTRSSINVDNKNLDDATLITQTSQRMAAGSWIDPPGVSAWDFLQTLQQRSTAIAQTQLLQFAFSEGAQNCFRSALTRSDLARAQRCLLAFERINTSADAVIDGQSIAQAKHLLAQTWLGVADERLGRNALIAARAALEYARQLDPQLAELARIKARLDKAQFTNKQ